MRKFINCPVILSMCLLSASASGQPDDWEGLKVPAILPSGMVWELQPISDSFNYVSTWNNRPPEFTSRWTDWFINAWSGPSLTKWDRGHIWTNGSELGVQAHHDPDSASIFMGCMSSLETVEFPFFMEARVRLSDCVLANNVWMLSGDSTEEIDMMETYPTSRPANNWLDQRMHLSHHVFIREPFQDYQPRDEEGVFGTWYWEVGRADWRDEWVRMGVYWKSPWHLEYYINGSWVRTIKRFEHFYFNEFGDVQFFTTDFNAIDKYDFTNGTGLSKPMHIIINMEQQSWMTDLGIIPTEAELDDVNGQNIFYVDWIRVYQGVEAGCLLGDLNLDGNVNLLDVDSFVAAVSTGVFQCEADTNEDGQINLLDVDSFIAILSGN